ncbi:MAG: ABC transporter permease [Marinilabiliaceae bacterium]|nr:ABC transporter permease [Marinilabiliaceae bacterium]
MQLLEFKIARRYLFAKKSQNIINVISWISLMGVLVGAAALLIVLSVFNGLHSFIGSLYSNFDPDLKVEVVEGKSFVASDSLLNVMRSTEGVDCIACFLADNALLRFGNRQMPSLVIGVDSHFSRVASVDSIIVAGVYPDMNGEEETSCVMGYVLAQQLGVAPDALANQLMIYAPKRLGNINMTDPDKSFIKTSATLRALFAVQQMEYDSQYTIVSLSIARRMFTRGDDEVSGIGIKLKEGVDSEEVKEKIQRALGAELVVKNRWEQHSSFFKMMEVEKFMAYLILLFILAIAAFNIIGSLSMLIFEKKESIYILKAMGAPKGLVTRVFLFEGLLVSVGGALVGLVLGVCLVLAQQYFGIINFQNAESYILESYPVKLLTTDILIVFLTVVVVGFLSAWYPVHNIVTRYYASK